LEWTGPWFVKNKTDLGQKTGKQHSKRDEKLPTEKTSHFGDFPADSKTVRGRPLAKSWSFWVFVQILGYPVRSRW
jgi:hypothetical protein